MRLRDQLAVLASGAWVRIGSENGEGWIAYNRTIHLVDLPDLQDAEVMHVYEAEGRENSRHCCTLEPGLAIIIAGRQNGTI